MDRVWRRKSAMNCVRWSMGDAALHGIGTSLVPASLSGVTHVPGLNCYLCPRTVPLSRLTQRCSRTDALVASRPLASAAERQYRWVSHGAPANLRGQSMSPSPSWKKSPPDLIERFARALPSHPDLVRKPMFGYPAAFAHGNMVCGLFQDSVVVRLGKEGSAKVIGAGRAQQFMPMPGRAMTGYVLVPAQDARDSRSLAVWLQRALDYTLTLPKKPSKPTAAKVATAKRKRKRA